MCPCLSARAAEGGGAPFKVWGINPIWGCTLSITTQDPIFTNEVLFLGGGTVAPIFAADPGLRGTPLTGRNGSLGEKGNSARFLVHRLFFGKAPGLKIKVLLTQRCQIPRIEIVRQNRGTLCGGDGLGLILRNQLFYLGFFFLIYIF